MQLNAEAHQRKSESCRVKSSPTMMVMAEVDDVMANILIRLPLKSLLRSKLVCKWWHRLISDPVFISNYSGRNAHLHVAGFYLQRFLLYELYSSLKFVTCSPHPLVAQNDPGLANLIPDDHGVRIQHSCNGLLLCSSFRCVERDRTYYICTPPTRQFLPLPKPSCSSVFGINLAFDPATSLYRLICIVDSPLSHRHRQILLCDSPRGSWRASGEPFLVSDDVDVMFNRGVLWEGALHWVGRGKCGLRFHVKDEVLANMPMPPIPQDWSERKLGYFGESGGHLYLIEIYGSGTTAFDVMQMGKKYSGWVVRYRVNLDVVAPDFTQTLRRFGCTVRAYSFSVLHMVHRQVGEKEECFMVVRIPGNFVLYDLHHNISMDVAESMPQLKNMEGVQGLLYSWDGVHPYTDALCYL